MRALEHRTARRPAANAASRPLLSGLVAATLVVSVTTTPAAASAEPTTLARVEALVRAALPAELALVELRTARPLDEGTVELALEWRSAPRAGSQSVALTTRSGGATTKRWLDVRLAERRRALVLTRDVLEGEELAPSDVTTRWSEASAAGGLALEPLALLGAKVTRALPAGHPLGEADVQVLPPIARGTEVTVVAAAGGARIVTPGILERSTRPGEPSAARLAATQRIVRGRLIDRTTFQVEGGKP